MNKRELLQSAWVPITKRLPPDTKEKVLTWNYRVGEPIVMEAWVARVTAEKLLRIGNEDMMAEDFSWDRLFSHWQPIVPPCHS